MLVLRRRSAAVLVALVASFTILLGATTRDAAQAFVPPIPVGAVSLPAAVAPVLFSPAGAVIAAIGIGAFFVLDGDEAVEGLADDFVCWITSCDKPDGRTDETQGPDDHFVISNPRYTLAYVLGRGESPGELALIGWGCSNTKPPGGTTPDYCAQQFSTKTVNSGIRYQVQCKGTTGLYTLAGASLSGTTGVNDRGVTVGAEGFPSSGIAGHSNYSKRVCGEGDTPVRVDWWQAADGLVQNKAGSWVGNGGAGPGGTQTRIDTTCTRPDGSTYVVTGIPVTDPKTVRAPECQPGDVATGTEVFGGPTGGALTSYGKQEISPQARTDYSECLTPQGQTKCSTQVVIDGVPCETGVAECLNWQQLDPSRVKCMWGPYSMPLTSCAPLANAYVSGYVLPDPSRSGNYLPVTPDGQPLPVGQPYNPNPGPTPLPVPDPGGGPGTNPGGTPNESGGADPDGEGNCWRAAISWNPVDWVMVPVKCALTWAFVPPSDTVSDVMESVGDVGPGPWIAAFGDLVNATKVNATGACEGPAWNFTNPVDGDGVTLHPFWACGSPQSVIANVVRIGLGVAVWLGAGIVCIRMVGAAFGLNLNGVGGRDGDDA